MPTSRNRAQSASRPAAGLIATGVVLALGLGVTGCNPTVKVEAPDKPIVINLNVKIEQEVRIKVDKDVESLVNNNPDLF